MTDSLKSAARELLTALDARDEYTRKGAAAFVREQKTGKRDTAAPTLEEFDRVEDRITLARYRLADEIVKADL